MLNKDFYKDKNIILKDDEILKVENGKVQKKKLSMSLNDIHQQLKNIGFQKPYNNSNYNDYYSDTLEHYGIPYMNYIYYLAFFRKLRIPTFNDFISVYIETYCNKLQNGMYQVKPELNDEEFQFTKKQLIGRVFRSYNSFHRELELFFQMREEQGISVKYDFQDDLKGIDFTLTYKNKTFGIASYVESKKSLAWKQIKNKERHQYDIEMFDMVARMHGENKNCIAINGIYVYNKKYVKNILHTAKE